MLKRKRARGVARAVVWPEPFRGVAPERLRLLYEGSDGLCKPLLGGRESKNAKASNPQIKTLHKSFRDVFP